MKQMAAVVLALGMMLAGARAWALTLTGPETQDVARQWAQSAFFPRMEALTGVHMDAQSLDEEAYEALLSGMLEGEIPADVLFKAELTRTQERELLDAGALIDLAPLIEENMPNLSALLEENPAWREVIALEDGRIASLPLLSRSERQVCVWINATWLEQLGIAMPGTVEELTQALLVLRDADPNGNGKADEIAADLTGVWEMRWLLPYFGIVADDYHIARVEGSAVFAPELAGYRDFVELLRSWYEQGILQPQAFTAYHSVSALQTQEEDAPVVSALLVSMTPFTHVPAQNVTDYRALLIPGPDGETVWRDLLGSVWTGCFAVTSACEDPEAALRWVDALYGEEGARLAYAGVEGEDYIVGEDGSWTLNVQATRPLEEIQAEALMYTGTTMPGLVPQAFLERVDSDADRHVFAESAKVLAVARQVTTAYALDAASQARADALALTIGGCVDRGIARFVTGETPLDDEHWNAWLQELRQAGSEELVNLFNQAK